MPSFADPRGGSGLETEGRCLPCVRFIFSALIHVFILVVNWFSLRSWNSVVLLVGRGSTRPRDHMSTWPVHDVYPKQLL
jgi:hypothetical protein